MQPMMKVAKYAGSVQRNDVTLTSDPAPSLLSYRMQRLWLTPLFRALVRVGFPAFGIVGLGWMFLSQADNRDYLRVMVQQAKVSVQNQPMHQLQTLTIEGASPLLLEEIRAQFGKLFPISAFELDLEGMRGWIEGIPSVEHAAVLTSAGGLLSVQVTEIQPEFIWRSFEGLQLISAQGDLLRRDRLRGLVRIGERRWDLVLLDGQTIALPEANPEQVLAQVIVLSAAQDLFERDILLMDFRNPRRPTLRLRPQALAGLKQVKGVIFSEIAK
jgi:cell division protein FtsQ